MLLINWATCDCFMRIIKDNHSILARARRGSLCLHAAVEFSQALRWGLHWHCKGCRCCFGSGAPCCRLKEYKVSLFLGGSSDPLAGCSFGEISRPWDQQARTVAHFGKCQWILSLRSKLLNFVSQFNEPVGKMTSILMEPHVTVAGMQQRQFPRNPPSQQSIAWCTPKHTAEDQCNVQCRPYVNMLKRDGTLQGSLGTRPASEAGAKDWWHHLELHLSKLSSCVSFRFLRMEDVKADLDCSTMNSANCWRVSGAALGMRRTTSKMGKKGTGIFNSNYTPYICLHFPRKIDRIIKYNL